VWPLAWKNLTPRVKAHSKLLAGAFRHNLGFFAADDLP
jgi:hypothetical protein